jgi:uncharacterized peroxidase-related enzyme
MVRDDERKKRAAEAPVVGGLSGAPGITAAMGISPGIALHLRGLADELLVKDLPGATLTRGERELLATAVSAANDCFFCMDSHGAFANELLRRAGDTGAEAVVDGLKAGGSVGLGPKMVALVAIARTVQRDARGLTRDDVKRALDAGASDADTQLAVLIASAFSMYNRMVDGLRAPTPPTTEPYAPRAVEIADRGYSAPR